MCSRFLLRGLKAIAFVIALAVDVHGVLVIAVEVVVFRDGDGAMLLIEEFSSDFEHRLMGRNAEFLTQAFMEGTRPETLMNGVANQMRVLFE